MLEDFIFSVNAVFPIFLVISVGYFLRRGRFLSANTIAEMNRLVFSFALPLLLFRNIYQADFSVLFDMYLILWILGSLLLWFGLLWAFSEIYLRRRQELIGGFVQASFRANYAIVGIPLVANIMGEGDTGMAALAAAFIVTSYNLLSVIVLTAKDSRGSSVLNLSLLKGMAIGVFTNPSIVAIALAVALNLLGVTLPVIVQGGVNYMAVLCTPLALLAVGGSIQIDELMEHLRPAIVGSLIKIVIGPLAFMAASVWLGFRGESLAVLFVMFANPTAIVSYAMASRMNGHTPITAAIIMITTVFSSLSLTLGVYLMRTMELL